MGVRIRLTCSGGQLQVFKCWMGWKLKMFSYKNSIMYIYFIVKMREMKPYSVCKWFFFVINLVVWNFRWIWSNYNFIYIIFFFPFSLTVSLVRPAMGPWHFTPRSAPVAIVQKWKLSQRMTGTSLCISQPSLATRLVWHILFEWRTNQDLVSSIFFFFFLSKKCPLWMIYCELFIVYWFIICWIVKSYCE